MKRQASHLSKTMATTTPSPPPSSLPTTMRKYQYTSTTPTLEANLHLLATSPLPIPKPNQHLIRPLHLALNPIDHKPTSLPVVGRILAPRPATPGLDISAIIVTPAPDTPFKAGDLVFGVSGTSPFAGGGLAEYAVAAKENVVLVPKGVSAVDAACIPVAGLTAYQSIVPRVKKGDRVFINGGSGGTGVFGIQIAKVVGCFVATTCSGANVELCKSLGADEVIDYRKEDVVEGLKAIAAKEGLFDHVVDNIGGNYELFWRADEYAKREAAFVGVGGEMSMTFMYEGAKIKMLPRFLGGSARKKDPFWPRPDAKHLEQIAEWMREGKVKAVVDSRFEFEKAAEAFARIRSKRARGKVVIDIADEKA